MKTQAEILELLTQKPKVIEKELQIKIRNGQTTLGIRKALYWVLK